MSGHPNWTPELAASVARIEAERAKSPPRVRVGWMGCSCGRRAMLYSGDVRARGLLRFECRFCGAWGESRVCDRGDAMTTPKATPAPPTPKATCEVCGRERMPPCPHQGVEAGSMRCLDCGRTVRNSDPVFKVLPTPRNACRSGHYADNASWAAECLRLGYDRQKATADRRGKLLEALAAAGPLEAFRPELAKRIRAELEGT